jgi:hypothetical protein
MREPTNTVLSPAKDNVTGLVGVKKMLEIVFPDPTTRPTPKTIDRRRKEKRIPFVKLGNFILYSPIDVERALRASGLK